jgi:hypothetical protein
MSRGPGTAQTRIMGVLAAYHRLGNSLGWEWRVGGSHGRKLLYPDQYESDREIYR